MALTPKQEHFCRLVASGKDYTNAYLTAYDWHGSTNGAQIESTKLANKPEIQCRIQTLLKPLEIKAQKDALNNRQQQIEFIQSRIEHCIANGDEQSTIRYTDMLNKIYALYKESETETKQQSSVSKVDTDTLKRLTAV